MKLWDFALEFYASDGVAPLCLELQHRAGVDVNILIYAVWLASRNDSEISRSDIAKADASVRAWREEVVRPMRAVRRYLKAHSDPVPSEQAEMLRDDVKNLELAAERLQLEVLERGAPDATNAFKLAPPWRVREVIKSVSKYYDDEAENIMFPSIDRQIR